MEPEKEEFCFKFDPQKYTPRNCYVVEQGSRQFEKHYFPKIHDLHYKTPGGNATSEEYLCAEAIDMNPKVEFWIRIIERSVDPCRKFLVLMCRYEDNGLDISDQINNKIEGIR